MYGIFLPTLYTKYNRETTKDGIELFFDHGAPYFTVTNTGILDVIHEWESRGLIAEWREKFGIFDCISKSFIDPEEDLLSRKYVGLPGMNSICKALCNEPGVESKFGIGVAKMEWATDRNSWSLISLDGRFLGDFGGLIATDKILASPGFTNLTGHPPPLDMNLAPQLASRIEQVPFRSYFVLMLAFSEPLQTISVKGFSFKNSQVLTAAFCDSSKPGRSSASECWVLHSTEEYAKKVIAETGLEKASDTTFARVSEELLQEFQRTGLCTSEPYFMKAHRWGSAFPSASIAKEDKCLWDANKPLIVCGDFCVNPSIEGAIESGLAAASKFMEMCRRVAEQRI
ncbi:Renalase [Bienertia sinuspersici]